MALFRSKDSSGNLECNFAFLSGFEDYQYKTAVCIKQNDTLQKLEINKRTSKETPFYLNYSQITGCDIIKNLKIEKDGNNVVSNAVIGGLILGPLGAIIGGMSGVGSKSVLIPKCFVINYHPANNPDDTNAILFEVIGASLHWENFVKGLKIKTSTITIVQQSRQL